MRNVNMMKLWQINWIMVCNNPAPGAYIQCTCCTNVATGRSEAGSYPLAGGSHIVRQGNQKYVDEASKPRIT